METVGEEVEEYSYREVVLPSLIPVVGEPELERESGERRRGRNVLLAIDHGPNSKHAFDWAVLHFCRLADTLHLVHAVSNVHNEVVYDTSRILMEKLAVEAFEVAMVKTTAWIVEGDPGKAICKGAEKLKPVAVILGTRGRGLIKREVLVNTASIIANQLRLLLFQEKRQEKNQSYELLRQFHLAGLRFEFYLEIV